MNTVFYHDLTTRNAKSIVGTIIHHLFCSLQIFCKIKYDRFYISLRDKLSDLNIQRARKNFLFFMDIEKN